MLIKYQVFEILNVHKGLIISNLTQHKHNIFCIIFFVILVLIVIVLLFIVLPEWNRKVDYSESTIGCWWSSVTRRSCNSTEKSLSCQGCYLFYIFINMYMYVQFNTWWVYTVCWVILDHIHVYVHIKLNLIITNTLQIVHYFISI